MSEQVEQILVIPTQVFHDVGHFQGFSGEVDRYLPEVLNPEHASYRPRPEMEEDPSFKQLIPYCIFRCGDEIFRYQRGSKQGETRLHAKWSVGVGGHISSVDLETGDCPYTAGMQRELEEEVEIGAEWKERCIGLINDDETEVGRVHLGVVHIFDVEYPKVSPREESMVNAGFVPLTELVRNLDEFETWSSICLKFLLEEQSAGIPS